MKKDILNKLIDLVSQSLCSVQPYTIEQVKEEIMASRNSDRTLLMEPTDVLMQGDILTNIKVPFIDDDNQIKILTSDAIVLSNSCNCQRKDEILLAPIFDDKVEKANEINTHFELMGIDEAPLIGKAIDFNKTFSLKRSIVDKRILEKKSEKLKSLTIFGVNLLYLKLTIFLMRPMPKDEEEIRTTTSSTL